MALTTVHLDTFLKSDARTAPYYRGIYPSDQLGNVSLRSLPACIVVNTSPSTVTDGHWIAIYIGPFSNEVFCSFGLNYDSLVHDFITYNMLNVSNIRYNPVMVQSPSSSMCGYYVAAYLVHRCQDIPMVKFLRHFTADLTTNDKIVKSLLTSFSH
jgi:hypothetical protein